MIGKPRRRYARSRPSYFPRGFKSLHAYFARFGDETAAENIQELLINTAPNGEDEELDSILADAFEFDEDSDAAVLDATYKRALAIRNGKKTIIRKRISGTVRLSAKQKMAIKKAQRKAHSGAARAKRLKSMKRRQKMGL